jgi:hypothetical protein
MRQGSFIATAMAAFVLFAFGAVSPAQAGQCDGGEPVTITGTVLRAFANDGGGTTLDVRGTSPCDVQWVTAQIADPPTSCRYGATFTATGAIDDLFGVMLIADSLECE